MIVIECNRKGKIGYGLRLIFEVLLSLKRVDLFSVEEGFLVPQDFQRKCFVIIKRIYSKKLHAQRVLNNYIRYIMLKLLIITTTKTYIHLIACTFSIFRMFLGICFKYDMIKCVKVTKMVPV